MSEEEISLLKKNVELFLRRIMEFTKDDPESCASSLVDFIRGEGYEIRRWRTPEKYLLVPEGESPPVCRGCFNEHGSCGTSCVTCEKWSGFEKEWRILMMMPDRFYIWQRKEASG